MKPLCFATLVLLATPVSLLSKDGMAVAQADQANSGEGNRQSIAKVIVRVYSDWVNEPREYVMVAAPLEGSQVKTDALRRAYTGRASVGDSGDPIVVVMPEDQKDQGVIDALGGCIFAQLLRQGSLALRPGDAARVQQKPCVFLDLLGEPVPNAQVEILISPAIDVRLPVTPQVWIADAKLDGESYLQPPQCAQGLSQLTFQVVHPDCGVVRAIPRYASEDEPHHVYKIPAMPRYRWCVFLDALGRPMAGASVQVMTSGLWEQGRVTYLEPIILDDGGRMRPPPVLSMPGRCSFIVSDANSIAVALVEPYDLTGVPPREMLELCVVPLVAGGQLAQAGGISGTVVDSEGNRVPAAMIACTRIVVRDGQVLSPYWPWPAAPGKEVKVLTDDRGRFAMCLPLADGDGKLGAPIPPAAAYEVTITPPAELGCQSWRGRLPAGLDHTIMLQGTLYGPEKYTGFLIFHDERGPVTDPEKIIRVNLTIRVRRRNFPDMTYSFREGEWIEKSALPFGMYEAKVDWDGKHYEFRRVWVTAESPETLVFRPGKVEPFETRYRGRVIHGVNGDPIADAVVMALPMGAREVDFTSPEFDPQSQAFQRLEEQMAGQMTKTDPSGRFELALPIVAQPGPEHAVIAIKKDFFPYRQPRSFLAPGSENRKPRYTEFPTDNNGKVILPEMKLFPAGVATIEPNTPDDCRNCRATLDFLEAADSPTPWLNGFQDLADKPAGSVIRQAELIPRKRQSVLVPAYVRMVLRVQLSDERYAPAFVEDVLVGQGKRIELERIDFARTTPITVKVVNSSDEPLAGVTVKCLLGEHGYPGPEAITNADGLARLPLPVHSTGTLVAKYEDRDTHRPVRNETSFQIAGEEDARSEFVLVFSDEFPEAGRNR